METSQPYHRSVCNFKAEAIAAAILACAPAFAGTNSFVWTAGVSVKETFDDNIYLQSVGPKADKSSLITTVTPQGGLTWKPLDCFDAAANYSAGINLFHDESSQDFVVHRGLLNLNSRWDATAIESSSSITGIDGSEHGPFWASPGGIPATGGPAVRDRHQAMVYRTSLRVTESFGPWFIRPTATYYLHDWGTEEARSKAGKYVYQNYVDRDEWTAGPDFGWKAKSWAVYAGYRFGAQNEAKLLQYPEQYDSDFHRLLVGIEGQVLPWLKANAALGPEFRHFADTVPATFDRTRLNLYVDASLTAAAGKCDTFSLGAKQFQQPGFSGRSAYTDLTYDFDWRHKIGSHWTIGAGARAYNTYFLRPVKRNDWVLTPNALINYAVSPRLNIEASAGYETGFTGNRNLDERDYERTFVALGVKWTLH